MENYKIEKKLGSGTFGEVFLASDLRNNQFYAIKEIDTVPEDSRELQREIKILQAIKSFCHMHLLCFEDIFEENQKTYIITEYLSGYDLNAYRECRRHQNSRNDEKGI